MPVIELNGGGLGAAKAGAATSNQSWERRFVYCIRILIVKFLDYRWLGTIRCLRILRDPGLRRTGLKSLT